MRAPNKQSCQESINRLLVLSMPKEMANCHKACSQCTYQMASRIGPGVGADLGYYIIVFLSLPSGMREEYYPLVLYEGLNRVAAFTVNC